MKRIFALLLCLGLTVSLFGCSTEKGAYTPTGEGLYIDGQETNQSQTGEDSANKYLVLAYYPQDSLNPYSCINYNNRTLFSLVYQGLFSVNRNYQAVPILCREYIMSEDMRTHIFYLENATFSDGSKITANDVLASYQAARDSKVYGGRFSHVKEITLTEDGGISFSLDTPMENLAILLDVPIVKADEVADPRPIGSGPYYYEDASAGLRLRRRADWWCRSDLIVSVSSIPLHEVTTVRSLRDQFEFSDVGLALSDPCSDSYVDYRCDYELWSCENGIFLYLGCNTASKVFSNQTIRSALTYAIDREYIVNTFYHGFAQAATLPASPASPYYSTKLAKRFVYEQDKFAQAVANAGYIGMEIDFLVNKDDSLRLKVARQIAQWLTEAGLRVNMMEVSNSRYKDQLYYGTFDLYLGQTQLSANMDLSPFFRQFGSLRYGNMTDSAIYSLCQQALANQGNYYNLHETVMEDGRLCPILFHAYNVHATRGLLTGLSPSRDSVFHYSVGKTLSDVKTIE